MKTIREIARLHLDKELSLRAIAASCKLSVSTVQGYVKKIWRFRTKCTPVSGKSVHRGGD